jgi:5-hydroxyisourate hydrolase
MAQTGYLSTHMLNTAEGVPAAGVAVELWRLEPEPVLLTRTVTTADGRNAEPFLAGEDVAPGLHELRFAVGAYFVGRGLGKAQGFLDIVPVRIRIEAGQGHYHVPLLCSPFSYTTYRGS